MQMQTCTDHTVKQRLPGIKPTGARRPCTPSLVNTQTFAQNHWSLCCSEGFSSVYIHIRTFQGFFSFLAFKPSVSCSLFSSYLLWLHTRLFHFIYTNSHSFNMYNPSVTAITQSAVSPLISLKVNYLWSCSICVSIYSALANVSILCCSEVLGDSGREWSLRDSSSNFSVEQLSSHLLLKEKSISAQSFNYIFLILSKVVITVVKKPFVSSHFSFHLFVA